MYKRCLERISLIRLTVTTILFETLQLRTSSSPAATTSCDHFVGGACRAKLAQCSFKCPVERCRQRRAARAASSAASRSGHLAVSSDSPTAAESPSDRSVHEGPQFSFRDSVSSMSDSQDGDMGAVGQQPTGTFFLVTLQAQCCVQLTCNI